MTYYIFLSSASSPSELLLHSEKLLQFYRFTILVIFSRIFICRNKQSVQMEFNLEQSFSTCHCWKLFNVFWSLMGREQCISSFIQNMSASQFELKLFGLLHLLSFHLNVFLDLHLTRIITITTINLSRFYLFFVKFKMVAFVSIPSPTAGVVSNWNLIFIITFTE